MVWDARGEIGYTLKADSIRKEVENSLRRLRIETIDLYQIHWPADDLPETEEGWQTLTRLKQEGKVRWIGASNFSVQELRAALNIAPVTSLQPPTPSSAGTPRPNSCPFACRRRSASSYTPQWDRGSSAA
jgi:aryl-alcohol dehydrogenase-like predicted oxidoreductase